MALDKLMVGPPDLKDVERPVYANVAHVSWTPYDVRITFSLLMTPHDGGARPPEAALVPQGVAEIVLPAAAAGALADLLRAELKEFSSRYGTPEPQLRQTA